MLTACADALIVDLSKTWSLAAYYGVPIIHVGQHSLADWLRPTQGLAALAPGLAAGDLPCPDRATAREWFAWHFGARAFYAATLDFDQTMRKVLELPTEADIATSFDQLLERLHSPHAKAMAA
jgi:hypothetical protein